MTRILHIDSSPRGAISHSRQMTKEAVDAYRAAHPETVVTYRDVGHNPPPHVDEAWTEAAFTPESERTPEQKAALQISDELVDELLAADLIVLGAPMYNFNVPSTLKTWIDQIIRVNRTFTANYQGLAAGRKVVVITARGGGGYGAGEAMAALNHQDPFLRTVFGFIGIHDVEFIHLNNLMKGDEPQRTSLTQARAEIQHLVAQFNGI